MGPSWRGLSPRLRKQAVGSQAEQIQAPRGTDFRGRSFSGVNLCVLTTETPHHAYFVKSLREKFPGTRVFCETGISRQPASRLCGFEKQRDEWEWAKWFKGEKTPISVLAPTENFPTLNSSEAIGCLRAARPDIILVFGTGILQEPILQIRPRGTFNLHGGNPEEYRGLDTHLWAIFERKFNDLIDLS